MAKHIFISVTIFLLIQNAFGQNVSSIQDSSLNNLVHPEGYITCKTGELGTVKRYGSSKKCMILIPGLGFGESVWKDFIIHYQKEFTIYAITPAGFAGTPAPPMPDSAIPYSQLTWTNGIVTGILKLIEMEKLNKPIIVAHFVTATQVTLNLALNYIDKIGKVIIISGSPYRYYASQKNGQWNDWEHENKLTREQRSNLVEKYWAPQWFKTVTKKTWDENMWTPEDFCKDSTIGNQLFKTSANVPVQIMIRYLIEWMAYDVSSRYKELKTPTLILTPDFRKLLASADTTNIESCKNVAAKQYLKYFHQLAWAAAKSSGNPLIQLSEIPDSGIFMWHDNPQLFFKAINKFIK
ncbi:hypothetical protein BH11BAC1_BH11BAC1_09670 [soil metagenome]